MLRSATAQLEAAGVDQPRLHAELLAARVLGCDRAYLFAYPERELSGSEQADYDSLIARRASGEPLQYLTGHQEFWRADFLVSPAVLIPRPETEHLIEAVLDLIRQFALGPRLKLIDVGTGSGAIAISLARELPQAEVHAVDLSAAALEVARSNAERLGARVQFGKATCSRRLPATPASTSSYPILRTLGWMRPTRCRRWSEITNRTWRFSRETMVWR